MSLEREIKMSHTRFPILVVLLCITFLLFAQGRQTENTAAPSATPVTAGQETFRGYCASCHGPDGKGNGPEAPALKNKPPDLTQLSKTNGGKFPATMVQSVIQGDQFVTAHGSREMPIWGEAFRTSNHDDALAKIKVHNLVIYIESIQRR